MVALVVVVFVASWLWLQFCCWGCQWWYRQCRVGCCSHSSYKIVGDSHQFVGDGHQLVGDSHQQLQVREKQRLGQTWVRNNQHHLVLASRFAMEVYWQRSRMGAGHSLQVVVVGTVVVVGVGIVVEVGVAVVVGFPLQGIRVLHIFFSAALSAWLSLL